MSAPDHPGPSSPDANRGARYREVRERLAALLAGEDDWIAGLATVASELHDTFDHYDWTGFYRVVTPGLLVVGPYQGTHGCLRIAFTRGVCCAAARTRVTQLVERVSARPDHIACSASTQSEIVVPVIAPAGQLLAVLDVDSAQAAAFDDVDRAGLEEICRDLGAHFPLGENHRVRPVGPTD